MKTETKTSFLNKPVFTTITLNWEVVLYIIIIVLAVATRFYNLGDRVMSHDESLHALFSYKLYNGEGYIHDPLMHGPLQFHLVALSYLLFGDNDFAARIPVALFGVALVMLPIWFRRWLGKVGALVTSFGLLISPLLLYYDRYIRNESYIAFFTALLALSLFQFMRTRKQRWLYIGAVAVALSLSAKEVTFIHGFIGVVFIAAAWMWEQLPVKRSQQVLVALGSVAVLLLVAALTVEWAIPPAEGTSNGQLGGLLLMVMGLLLGVLTIAANADRQHKPVSSTLAMFADRNVLLAYLGGPIVVAAVLFFVLHTTFFTNPAGAISGTWGAVTYWLKQQGVERGKQPGYYYLVVTPMYEFLPLLLGGIGGLTYLFKKAPGYFQPAIAAGEAPLRPKEQKKHTKHHPAHSTLKIQDPNREFPADGGTFAAYLIFWTIASFVIYSWAGEKMPWLAVHITLPFIFLMGHVSQTVFNKFDWRILKTSAGLLFILLVPLLGAALLATITVKPFQGQSIQALQATSRFIVALLAGGAIVIGLWRVSHRLPRSTIKPMLYLVVFAILSLLTIRFAWLSSYVNYNYVNEFLVYAHGAPDVKWVINEVDDISRRTVGDKQIKVAYGGVIWPLEWYMRNYPNRAFFGANPNREAFKDAPVVIISPDDKVKLEDVTPFLGDKYRRFDYRQVWWPIENYKDQSLSRIWRDFFVPALPAIPELGQSQEEADRLAWERVETNRKWLWDVLFYRKVDDHTFKDWPYRTQMYMFVRKDILAELWNYNTGEVSLGEPTVDPYANVRVEQPATLVWGSNGAGNGQFTNPRAITISPQGQVYVADSGNHRIEIFDQAGNFLKTWTIDAGNGPGQVGDEMWGIAVSNDGKVYISDTWNHRVEIFDEDGNYLSAFGAFADAQGNADAFPGSFWGPRDIVIDADGNLYVADTGNKRVQKFSPDGQFLGAWGGGGVVPGRFEEPVGLALDADGNIYVTDTWNQRVQKFDPAFNPLTQWPVVGWDTQNVVNKPYIAVDSQNRVYITDPENYRVIVYSSNGDLLSTFGQYGQDVQSFKLPLDLAIAPDDSLFVLDSDNNRVMKFTADRMQ